MSLRSVRYGSLQCVVVDSSPDAQPETLVVLAHGFGAPGDDLVPLAREFQRLPGTGSRVRYLFPAAPLSLDAWGMPGARAWWPISIQTLLSEFEQGNTDVLKDFSPEELPAARDALDLTISIALEEAGLNRSQLVLGGFSQGAMISAELALHRAERIAGLILWSGTLIRRSYWEAQAKLTPPLNIVQSHGRGDQILPFQTGVWLRDLLSEAGHDVQFISFSGPHTIPYEAIQAAAELIGRGEA